MTAHLLVIGHLLSIPPGVGGSAPFPHGPPSGIHCDIWELPARGVGKSNSVCQRAPSRTSCVVAPPPLRRRYPSYPGGGAHTPLLDLPLAAAPPGTPRPSAIFVGLVSRDAPLKRGLWTVRVAGPGGGPAAPLPQDLRNVSVRA